MLYSCNSILVRIMIPPYEIVSLLQLGISDASVFKNIISKEIIVDKRFSTFFTVDGLIEMIVFLSDKITRVSYILFYLIIVIYKSYFYNNLAWRCFYFIYISTQRKICVGCRLGQFKWCLRTMCIYIHQSNFNESISKQW